VDNDAALLLRALYAPDEFLFIGGNKEPGTLGGNVRTVREWLEFLEAGGTPGAHFIINPLTGCKGTTTDRKPSYRADSCVAAWRYALIEFDGIPKWQQAAFWLSRKLPVAAIIDSGGKSLHGLLEMGCNDADQWRREVKPLYTGLLKELGADPACSNPARMSRTPGVRRGDSWQRLVWLRAHT